VINHLLCLDVWTEREGSIKNAKIEVHNLKIDMVGIVNASIQCLNRHV